MDNIFTWSGKWNIRAVDTDTQEVLHEETIHNMIMNVALDELYKPLYGVTADLELKYLAIGTSATAVAPTQTALDTEVFRTTYQSLTTSSNQEVISNFIVIDSEAQVLIEEIGIFGGTSASGTTDSGTMISRILFTYDKTPTNIELQFQRTDKVQRG